MKKIALIILTVFALTFTTFTSSFASTVEAKEKSSNSEISNLEFTTLTDEKLEYTYTQDNEEYKVIEFIKNDFTEVESFIYKKDNNTGKYDEIDHLFTKEHKEKVTTKSLTNNNEQVIYTPELEANTESGVGEIGTFSNDSGGGGGGDWTYSRTEYGSSKAAYFTVAAIALTVASITKVPKTVKWVMNIAALYYSFGKDVVYYKYMYYHKGSGITSDSRVIITVYKDSSRSSVLGTNVRTCSRTGCTNGYY